MNEGELVAYREEIELIERRVPSIRGRLRANLKNQCLEYIGPRLGRMDGNPQVKDRESVRLLRRVVWEIYKGRLRKGQTVRMTCRNGRCHWYDHMTAGNRNTTYNCKKPHPGKHLSVEEVRAIRYFKGFAPLIVIHNVFGIFDGTIRNIWAGKTFTKVKMPKRYRPRAEWIRRIESEMAKSHAGLSLDRRWMRQAEADIRKTELEDREREVLLYSLKGGKIGRKRAKYTNWPQRIYYIRQCALVKVWNQRGAREWIRLVTKNRIEKWAGMRGTSGKARATSA